MLGPPHCHGVTVPSALTGDFGLSGAVTSWLRGGVVGFGAGFLGTQPREGTRERVVTAIGKV